jgi:tripartite-type tricarboxylate transporter receptor subunit TctC
MSIMHPILLACAGALCTATATAQNFPSKPVTMIVPFAAGGPLDAAARVVALPMGKSLGQTVVVENSPGAAGSTGTGRIARAGPDGYSIGAGNWSTHVINGAVYDLSYDLLADLVPVGLIATNPQLIVSHPSIPAKDLKGLIAWLKAHPDKVSAGTAGVGSASHVSGVYFQNATGTRFQFVAYKGGGPALLDVVGGHIELMVDQISNSMPQVRSGRIRAYAITAPARNAAAPAIPTVDEAGLPGFYVAVWSGIWAPRGTPRDVITRLNGALVAALGDPQVRQRLTDLGQDIPTREQQTPEALGALQKVEIDKWWPIVRAAGIKPE